ncbi:sugar phosphate isomerase/epimerase family protein [Algoriphagus zhangzhouensis]|uniref:D-psicose/D-tagatose/L-ribulose 3-epimerase n=1 Tax=Algoriphagus zhangzhouensis TaxID=1073327 RepID=A0A1M7ZEM7_9BACT|nr:sugar phosphate isomerase/epimerase family protein [Algoriphagus zhangzhouensis]TDY46081.1 D-psicose/D-tagatose/L-ribulose 3-epimerase [Algoriphagus zhangzhouensis]SHO63337.1 D-psicose/D-tagatose/L-ribulose 3-epimerase [Algoriphagus zhangzhouensis]
MNKIGFNVLAWSAEMSESLLPILDRLKEIGYDGAEFFIGGSPEESFKMVGKHCADIGLEVTTVTVLSPEENPISPDGAVREKSKERLRWVLDRAADLNSQVLCGPFHSAFATFASRAPMEDEYNWSAEVLHEMGDYAQKLGILLTPEALNRFECYLANTMEQLDYLLTKVNHPNVQAMFDTHHANMEEKKLGSAIELIAPKLGHFHISENDRGTPGSGHVDFDETFATLKKVGYSGWLTIEGFTRNDPAFANSIGVWRNFSEPWDMAENGYKLIREKGEKYGL